MWKRAEYDGRWASSVCALPTSAARCAGAAANTVRRAHASQPELVLQQCRLSYWPLSEMSEPVQQGWQRLAQSWPSSLVLLVEVLRPSTLRAAQACARVDEGSRSGGHLPWVGTAAAAGLMPVVLGVLVALLRRPRWPTSTIGGGRGLCSG